MADTSNPDVDGIRYLVLRKLAPGLRHALMGELQATQFAAELALRLLDADPHGPKVAASLRQVADHTRATVGACHSVFEWLRPDDDATAAVDATVRECLRVAGDDWSLRGFAASLEMHTSDARVSRCALRELLVTSLLALIDAHTGPLDFVIGATGAGDEVEVRVRVAPAERASPALALPLHRALTLDDVLTVGRAHGAPCSCSDHSVSFRLPAAPLDT